LKKIDSFSRWLLEELAEVVDLDIKSCSDAFWTSTETCKGKGFRTEPGPDRFPLPLSFPAHQMEFLHAKMFPLVLVNGDCRWTSSLRWC
jgi:hypothetical protein